MTALTLQEQFGQIDIYLFDQLLKGRITPGMRILDAGCGEGYYLRELAAAVPDGQTLALLGPAWAAADGLN